MLAVLQRDADIAGRLDWETHDADGTVVRVHQHAGPTMLAGRGDATYSARVVAFRQGDTTLFRHFVAVTPPVPRRGTPGDAPNPAGLRIGFCGALRRAAAVHGAAPGQPDGEEKLPVWSRRR